MLLILLLLSLSLQSLTFAATSARPRCSSDEISALVSINRPSSIGVDWKHVKCDPDTGHVISLTLHGNDKPVNIASNSTLFVLRRLERLKIYGSSYQLQNDEATFETLAANLTSLMKLDLEGNDLSSVPLAMLTRLSSSLTLLRLHDCRLQGELPKNFFSSFPVLKTLDLSYNKISGQISFNFSNSESRLTLLSLSSNNFRGQLPEFSGDISTMIGFPINLRFLELDFNSIEGPIPSWIYALPYLEELDLSTNRFSGEIGEFKTTSLTNLFLTENLLRGSIPKSIFRQLNLTSMKLYSNSLTGTLDLGGISMLKKLNALDISYNNLSSLSSVKSTNHSSRNMSLAYLYLSNNKISGVVPKVLWDIGKDSLEYLDLSHNSLTYIDSLPWNNLVKFQLGFNSFSGSFPVSSAPRLILLSARKNNFSGEIPLSIWNMTSLQSLDLSYNNIIGEISNSVCYMKVLGFLGLSNNKLSGTVPRCMGNISNHLNVIDLQKNNLHGTIAAMFLRKSELTSLHLNGNQFKGELPKSLSNCTKLEVLDLGDNVFSGMFPNWLESLPDLRVLVLRANRFHGPLGNTTTKSPFPNLIIMDVSRNKFTGELPMKYFENFQAMQKGLRSSTTSYIQLNRYYQDSVVVSMKGSYVEIVKILNMFTVIDFSRNNFTGEIPSVVGRLDSLIGLNLSHNSLGGSIPLSMRKLSSLEWLDLSFNRLVGHIPGELANIPWLSFLNLSHNHLTGPIPNGKQFNTFTNNSYVGNLDLCGFPITEACGSKSAQTDLEPNDIDDDNENGSSGFSIWKLAMMGFASGFVIGISIGYVLLFSDGKLSWISGRILGERQAR